MCPRLAWFVCVFLVFIVQDVSPFSPARGETETARELAPEDEELLVQIISQKASELEELVQAGRKFLQKVRVWQGSHPAESRLAKCAILYIAEEKIPGLVDPSNWEEDYKDQGLRLLPGRRGLPAWNQIDGDSLADWSGLVYPDGEPSPRSTSVEDIVLKNGLFKKRVIKLVHTVYLYVKDLFSTHKLFDCSLHYLVAKFWEWVDSAP